MNFLKYGLNMHFKGVGWGPFWHPSRTIRRVADLRHVEIETSATHGQENGGDESVIGQSIAQLEFETSATRAQQNAGEGFRLYQSWLTQRDLTLMKK
jgi:hypothetical protein